MTGVVFGGGVWGGTRATTTPLLSVFNVELLAHILGLDCHLLYRCHSYKSTFKHLKSVSERVGQSVSETEP